MKKILITGANSYIGTSFENYIKQWSEEYSVDTVDMIDGTWRERSFAGYDVVFHVAGIAHSDTGNVSDDIKRKYYEVNTDLTIETAKKAKIEGVKHFIFMSSMIVYGNISHITKNTEPKPTNFYGDSKWQADDAVRKLGSEFFKVAVLRPPMIYGKGSKGNYPLLSKLARKLPVFPKINNKRSMLHIDNLCEFLCRLVESGKEGVFFPQNAELVNTSDMVKVIAEVARHKIYVTSLLNPFVIIGKCIPGKLGNLCKKAFGSSYYNLDMSDDFEGYRVRNFPESINATENM